MDIRKKLKRNNTWGRGNDKSVCLGVPWCHEIKHPVLLNGYPAPWWGWWSTAWSRAGPNPAIAFYTKCIQMLGLLSEPWPNCFCNMWVPKHLIQQVLPPKSTRANTQINPNSSSTPWASRARRCCDTVWRSVEFSSLELLNSTKNTRTIAVDHSVRFGRITIEPVWISVSQYGCQPWKKRDVFEVKFQCSKINLFCLRVSWQLFTMVDFHG